MVTSLTPPTRTALLDELDRTLYDVVIVGGGIAGAGIARDVSARGLSVALIEADDFASGTSSRSSKLIHGGLRYLANGQIGFVRQMARERLAVHEIARHLSEPCWMVVPAHSRTSAAFYKAAISFYETLGAVAGDERHVAWRGAQISDHEPSLRHDVYQALSYREYLTDDAGLVIGVLRAAVGYGAVAANRVSAVGLTRSGSRVDGVLARCDLTEREIAIRGRVVVNAAGPWVDDLSLMEHEVPRRRHHLSKGVHIVVQRERLPVSNPVLCSTDDHRWIFVIPRGEVVYVGTTDTAYNGSDRLWPEVDAADVRYLLAPLGRYFDSSPLDETDVVGAWAGVRSLAASRGRKPRTMSRKDEVTVGPGAMISIAGGKLTGFHHLAESVADVIGDQLGQSLAPGPGLDPIPGSDPSGPPCGDARLSQLYGTEAASVMARGPDPVVPGGSVLAGEIDWAIDIEGAITVEDVLYRRTRAATFLPGERERLAPPVTSHMAERMGWDAQRQADELDSVCSRFAYELAFKETT